MKSLTSMVLAIRRTIIQSMPERDVVLNIPCRNGVYITANCKKNDEVTAIIRNLLENPCADRQLNTLKIWNMTKTVKAILIALMRPVPLLSKK